ncbi:MAG: hypothetical protein JRD04_03815 [Deltaproteobacteria bacterium]|nr:hypothetical protein [Deltaproteobacteria bacterium]
MKTMIKIDKKRKYVLMAMAFLLIAGGIYRIWPQTPDIFIADDTLALKKKQLVKYQRMFESGSDLEKDVVRLKVTLKQVESGLLTGKTPALAAADIQKIVHEMAKKSHVEIKMVRVLKPESVDGGHYLSIPVQLSIAGATRHLKEFVYQIMTSPKYLTVKKVGITVRLRQTRGKKVTENVSANITINGFLKSSNAPTT